MKTLRIIMLFSLALLLAGKVNAQMSIIIFSEKGEKFVAFIDNSRVNNPPETRITTERPGGPSFKVRISFEDSSIPEIQKTVFNTPESEIYYVIKGSSKGKMILEKTSSEYVFHDETVEEVSAEVVEESVPAEAGEESQAVGETRQGCTNPIDEAHFQVLSAAISNAPFDGPKLTQAKNMANKNCLTTGQIIDIIYIFSTEPTRLNFAKHAYTHCWDPENYSNVKDALLPPSQVQLQKFLDTQK